MQTGRGYNKTFGDWGERKAALFLVKKGYAIHHLNYFARSGEIDIVASCEDTVHGRTLCFVEVKTRRGWAGSAERATGRDKRARMIKAARHFCATYKIDIGTVPIRFEQVSVYAPKKNSACIRHAYITIEGIS